MLRPLLTKLSLSVNNKQIEETYLSLFFIKFPFRLFSRMSKHGKVSSESDLGISEYLNQDNPGFNGVIKERFSDFNVYEIDKSMNIVHLGDHKFPDEGVADQNIEYDDLTQAQKALVSEILFSRVFFDMVSN